MPLLQLSVSFQSLLLLPLIKLGPSGADFRVGGFVYVLGPCGSLQQTLLWGWEFLLLPQPSQVFSVRGFEALFPMLESWVAWSILLPSCSYWFICLQMLDCPLHQPLLFLPRSSSLCLVVRVLSAQLPVSTPPTGLDECFFFNSLVVRLPYSLIFCQLWLVFGLKFVVVLLLVVWGGTVCLPMPQSCLEVSLLPVLMWLLYILSYRTVQLDFWQFWMMVV